MKASILFSTAILLLGTPGFAQDTAEKRFEYDGITYVYQAENQGDHRVLSGRHYPSGARFRLVVRDDRVSGRMNGRTVNFRLSEIEEVQARDITLASR